MFRIILSLLLLCSSAYAEIEGVEHAELTIGERVVRFPVGDAQRKQDIYFLKKAIAGDNDAREMFLAGDNEKYFFIGEHSPLWLKVTKTGQEIVNV